MFRHKGKTRTLKHNLRIASLLSFVAGIVNVAGFLAVQRLTTNVTGHFAYLIDEVFRLEIWKGIIYFLYIFFFFLGSFTSNFLIEWVSRKNKTSSFTVPIFLESLILFFASFTGNFLISENPDLLAFSLLFAMGLQNSLVTTISNSTVRTTHLTGLFTDLGIELSQLFFYSQKEQKQKLNASIRLRLTIISFFFFGGIIGGIFYSSMNLYVLSIAGATLLVAVFYDTLKLKAILLKRKARKNRNGI
ncbi:YoaK family protein [Flavobacterium sp.]|uniref:YoaK family protein n=1 Tax=Flavobacterium sp. TaxID=239 RepID=UPI0039E63972